MNRFVTIASYQNPVEANIAKARLEDAEIDCFLTDENMVSMQWLYANAVGGIKLQVNDFDEERARKILSEEISYEDIDSENIIPDEEENFSSPGWKVVCPLCE